jgi:hypothetical protein
MRGLTSARTFDVDQGDVVMWVEQCLAEIERGEREPFHALLCDPPYHLTEIVKRFSSPTAAPAQFGSDGAFQRASKGFMGRTWDGGDIAFRAGLWASLGRLLYPGAFGMAFAGSRGWHRMACAIQGLVQFDPADLRDLRDVLALAIETRQWWIVEAAHHWIEEQYQLIDALTGAGFVIHPTIFGWNYLSGFPKATRIDTQLDRRAGAERPVVGRRRHAPKFAAAEFGYREKDNGYNSRECETFEETAPATELAADWEGYRYGLQALKPALEPIIVFQRPYEGRPVDCIAETGAGALNIDGGRIGSGDGGGREGEGSATTRYRDQGAVNFAPLPGPRGGNVAGRWPANFALSHHPACNGTCHPDCTVRHLGEQSGERKAGGDLSGNEPSTPALNVYGTMGRHTWESHGDTGTAARMFLNADWMYERLEAADAVGYFAKASSAEREAGLDPLQVALMQALYGEFEETTVGDGRKKPIDNPYQRGETARRNTHPTIKPISLTRWLATLLLPPERYGPRRLLVPFAGAGSEMIGAMLAGWETVHGVELEEDHVRIARARLAYWQARRHEFADGRPITVSAPRKAPEGQLGLFEEAA